MAWIDEKLTEQFYQWELRGRGWQVFDLPVWPEPPFRPFLGHFLPAQPPIDDGRKPTILNSLVQTLSRKLTSEPALEPFVQEEDEESEPEALVREPLVELQTLPPANLNLRRDEFAEFLSSLALCREPVTFELLSTAPQITAQFAVEPSDAPLVRRQLEAFFPDATFVPQEGTLERKWREAGNADTRIVEFGLAREFMLSLAFGRIDPFVALTGALSEVEPGEFGLYQVIFQPVTFPWAESILRALTDNEGGPFFVNAPELLAEAKRKVSRPLYAAVVRIAARSPDRGRALELARHLASALSVFANPSGNELIPLKNDDYAFTEHQQDVIRRQTHRSGMLLNSEELIGFVHLPSPEVRAPKLKRQVTKTRLAPKSVVNPHGLRLGQNEHAGQALPVTLLPDQRVRHLWTIGASGTGKSTLLYNLIRQDIEAGEGVAVLDPHGDLIDRLLGVIPEERIDDVILLDPSDEEYSIGFNILSAHSDAEKNLLASDLVSVFQRLSTSWGEQMGSVLQNAILAFLESERGGTLADLRRFLLEPKFRAEFLATVRDPDLVYYWQTGFPQLVGNRSIGPVLTRLETFLSRKPIRYMVSQKENRLDFAQILDTGKILLAKLSQGAIGRENSYLLGSLLMTKLQQTATSRQRQEAASRRDFWIYADEFHCFITPSISEILSGARKYRIGLTLAHQELRQLQRDPEVASAVMANCATRIVFRVGDADARALESGFSHFEARDLQNLNTGEAICRVERSDFDFNLKVPLPPEPNKAATAERRQTIITASRRKYGTARGDIEEELRRSQAEPSSRRDLPGPSDSAPPPRPSAVPTPPAPPPVAEPPPLPKAPAVPKPSEVPKAAGPPADLGRGGAQHQTIQHRLKGVAEGLGYRVTVEKPILGGAGSVDLVLEKPNRAIACEITITTTIDHEVGNVTKCLKAGFAHVAVVSPKEERLHQIQQAVEGCLDKDAAANVGYYTPDQFTEHLQSLVLEDAKAPPEPERRRGYLVKRTVAKLTPAEAKAREEAALKTLADTMRRKKSG